jgi:hypothetical protein
MSAIFYIYCDGSDLEEMAPLLRPRIEAFIALYGDRVRFVDQRRIEKEGTDLPNWDFGVNFEFDALTDTEKKDILLFFQSLSGEFDRDFIVGGLSQFAQADDFMTVSSGESLDPVIELLLTHEIGG